jgi:RNA polymerase sigma-70 factor (ECF subfamily)
MDGPTQPTDGALLLAARRGDAGAMDALVLRHADRLYAFCHRNLGILGVPAAEVDDVFQETWLRVLRAADRYDPARSFPTWLFSIAVNLCRDARRRRRIEVGESADAAETERPAETRDVPIALARLADAERRAAVERVLAKLPDAMRETITLRFYADMDLAAIAAATGVPVGTVKSRLFHAIRRIRELAHEHGLAELA